LSRPTNGLSVEPRSASNLLANARAQRLPCRHWPGDALELDLAEITVFEQITGQPTGTGGDHDGVGLGQGLQARGEIGRIAGDIVLDNLPADDHQPGGNPDPRMELFGLIELRHPTDQRQPAPRRALGVVLVRLRIAKIDQDAVAHVAGDKPAKPFDCLSDAAMVGAENPAQILGIEPSGQGRRADQIAEHDRELAALGVRSHRRAWRSRRPASECRDRIEQPPTVPDRGYPDAGQILGREPRQHLRVDIILAEHGLVLRKPEAT